MRPKNLLKKDERDNKVIGSENSVDRLIQKINGEYESMRECWWEMTADELIDNAEKIAAAKFIRANIQSCVNDDEAEYLEGFKDPLEVLIETMMYRCEPQNIAEQEWFSDHLYELLDKHDLEVDYETEEESEGMTMQ